MPQPLPLRKPSLQTVLITTVVAQITLAVGLTGWLSFLNGQRAVNLLASQVSQETTARIQQRVDKFLYAPHLFHQINETLVQGDALDLSDQASLRDIFRRQLQLSEIFSSIYYGSEEGDFFGVQRRGDGRLVFWERTAQTAPNRRTLALDDEGNPGAVLRVQPYDPRKRPWYEKTRRTQEPTWSEVYPFASQEYPLLGITATVPVFEGDRLQGVLAVDLTLAQISDFLSQLQVGLTGQAFIVERSGELIATSAEERPFLTATNDAGAEELQRLPAIDSGNPLTQTTTQALVDRFGGLGNITESAQLRIDVDGARQLVEVLPIQDVGLDWLVVVVIPESDFMAQIYHNTRVTLLLCLLSLALATLVAIRTSRWITRPVQQLAEAAQGLTERQWQQHWPTQTREIGALAQAFQHMARQLQQSFTSLESKNAELKQLDQIKDEFLANTSHELLTPLNGMIGISESLIAGATGKLSSETRSNLAMVVSSGERLARLVQDILDFSRLRNQTPTLYLKPTGLRVVVDVVLALSQPLIKGKPLTLVNQVPEALPQVCVDEAQLQQILHNLVGNAIKFTDEGSVSVVAEVLSPEVHETAQPLVAVTVKDTGPGIDPAVRDRIFEPFAQGDGSTVRLYGGAGLGLAIVKKLVELQGGRIWVDSGDRGTHFTFTLPIALPKALPAASSNPQDNVSGDKAAGVATVTAQSPPPQTLLASTGVRSASGWVEASWGKDEVAVSKEDLLPDVPLSLSKDNLRQEEPVGAEATGFKILIVDDDPINRQVLVNHLSMHNYVPIQAESGADVFALIEHGLEPDLVLLDVMLPRMSGYDICRSLRESFSASELPVLMLTAKTQVADLVEGLTAGANDYLSKPVSQAELLARIKIHLELSKTSLAYARFVPHEFLNLLGRDRILDVKLGDQKQANMTIMFADIRSFTALSEQMTPKESFEFLNSYLAEVSPVIRQYGGFVDKYIGDAVMAIFPNAPDDAIQAAISIQRQVSQYNQARQAGGEAAIAIGIGIHTGSLILGTIGEEERMESTVISDAVNLAARLEKLTKLYGAGIIVSAQTLAHIPEEWPY
ncbi:MAG: ATP-binding protein, partial [Elainellaceae cyanobacterium]